MAQTSSELSAQVPPEVTRAKQRFGIVGNSPALIAAIDRAVKVAPIDLSVLVTGESGSGKEFFPKIIHQSGARKHKRYIAVNCGAIPEGTIDSELFGHEKGAFTGAISSRKGYFEEADGGTIFLDEVAELPLTTQARLLRVLETGEFLKVGSSEVLRTNVRIVAATNVDLQKAVEAGRFREDLYYRLSTVVIQVPNLHDRGDDAILLARKFARDFSEKYLTAPISFSPEAGRAILRYRWPGNVRQLKNVVEQLALFEAGREVLPAMINELLPARTTTSAALPSPAAHPYETEREMLWQMVLALKNEVAALRARVEQPDSRVHAFDIDVSGHERSALPSKIKVPEPIDVDAKANPDTTSPTSDAPSTPLSLPARTLEQNERATIAAALKRNNFNKKRTAAELCISERTLYRKINEFGLDPAKQPSNSDS